MIPKALSVKLSHLTSSAAEPSCAECNSKRDSSEATFTRVQSFVVPAWSICHLLMVSKQMGGREGLGSLSPEFSGPH